jgi:superfamily II DNA or RNA helicase
MDVISEILKDLDNPSNIIDEFHNLLKNNVQDEKDDFYKLSNSGHRILSVSATPRVYELENDDYDSDQIFGPQIDTMTYSEAIHEGHITDCRP